MKIHPFTLGLLVVAGLLGGYVYFAEVRRSPQPESTQAQKLFGFEEKQVKALKLQTQLRSLSFERDGSGKWQMVSPDKTPANDASVAYLLNLVATAMNDRPIAATAGDLKSFGLDQPMATIEVTLDNRQTHKLVVGGYGFDRSQLYAQADPPASSSGELKVALVSPDFDNAVNRALAEWKAVPPETKSPTPSASASPSPAPSASPKPSPDRTPSTALPTQTPSSTQTPTPTPASPRPSPTPTP